MAAKITNQAQSDVKKIKLTEYHSMEYMKKQKEQLKEETVVFILPNGKEVLV